MKKEKILVAMSGGVDSSVVAALLVKQGYDVTGAYMKQWSDTKDVSGLCQWKKDRRDAMRVAAHLGIPLLTLDFEKEYKEWVMGYMFAEYEAGRTPNPDVMCNKFIKFDAWLKKILEMEFDAMATGHYACVKKQDTNFKTQYLLAQAKDEDKDQTYFLHQLTQEQLSHTMFPLGEYTKPEVRELARKFGLPTAEREESMGICFVGEMPMKDFLQQKIRKNPGAIVTEDGTVVGEHEGLAFYTIGQRHVGQLTISNEQLTNQEPMYVLEKRLDANELVVGFEDSELLYKKEIEVEDMHWISGPDFATSYAEASAVKKAAPGGLEKNGHVSAFSLDCKVRLRHRQELQDVKVTERNGKVTLIFTEKQRAVTPGQFAVLYKDGVCLGGGVIK